MLNVEGVSWPWVVVVPAPEGGEGAALTPSCHRALEVLRTVPIAGSIKSIKDTSGQSGLQSVLSAVNAD